PARAVLLSPGPARVAISPSPDGSHSGTFRQTEEDGMRRETTVWRGLAGAGALGRLAGPGFGPGAGEPGAPRHAEALDPARVEAVLKQVPPSPTPLTQAQKRQSQKDALDFLINDLVMKQFLQREFAGKPAVRPDSPEVTGHLEEVAADLKKKGKTLAQFLKES